MSSKIKVESNFDWTETRGKKLVVFMPNFHGNEFTEFSIRQIRTKVDPKDYLIIVGNDNFKKNWDHLRDKNVRYFGLLREDTNSRNSCYIRNYFLKRCESENVLYKDGEVVLLGDFIYNAIYFHQF